MDVMMNEDILSSIDKDTLFTESVIKGKDVCGLAITQNHLILNLENQPIKYPWHSVLGAKIVLDRKKSAKKFISIYTFSESKFQNTKISCDDPEKLVKVIQSMAYKEKMPEIYDSCYVKRLKVIINPNSGKGRARRVWDQVAQMFEPCEVSVTYTERRNHATELVTELNLSDFDGLIVISGDGLVHEVINALCKREDGDLARLFPVGVIPAGSANALAQIVCEKSNKQVSVENAAYICIKGCPQPYDISLVKFESGLHVYSFLCVFWAFIADVDIESEKCRCCGSCRFDMYGFWRVLSLRRYAGSIEWEGGQYNGPIVYFMACNAAYIGEGMNVAPKAEIDDGHNDLLYLGNVGRLPLIRVLLRQDSGNHLSVNELNYVKSKWWKLRPEGKRGIFSIDGELFECDNIEVEVFKEFATIISF